MMLLSSCPQMDKAHTENLVNEAAALLKAALEPHAPAEAEQQAA